MKYLKYFIILAALVLAVYLIAFRDSRFQEIHGKIFNTHYTVKIRTPNKSSSLNQKIQLELDKVNEHMSAFDPESELSRINQAPAGQQIELSPELSLILEKSYNIYKISNSRFDPTIGRLIDIWGFGTKKVGEFPTDEEIKNALKITGFNKIKFSPDFSKLTKTSDELTINLSAIAKGYAVDKVAELLKSLGYHDFVVEIGGEVYASGQKSNEVHGWNIGVNKPNSENVSAAVVTMKNMAVATSGDYRNYFYHNDKRYSHTIIPQTGYPVEHELASVTVFNQNCMMADGLATAIMTMGAKEGLAFANRNKIPTILFVRNPDDSFKMIVSNDAKKLIGE